MTDEIQDQLPRFSAPKDGRLTAPMLRAYREAGVLVLDGFVQRSDCRKLRDRAMELVDGFDPATVKHVFSTTKQTQLQDAYFYESGDKIRFFLEDDAFDETGELRQSKYDSLNKMGHAMHDLDSVFDAFWASSSRCTSSNHRALVVRSFVTRIRRSFTRSPNRVPVSGSHWRTRRWKMAACISSRGHTKCR
jgi:hypothetical protein